MTLRTLASILIAALASTTPGGAQEKAPGRPMLPPSLDPKDWRDYYKCGLQAKSAREANVCLYWASRLNPASAEPYFAQWLVSEGKNDSLLAVALERDPFIHSGRVVVISKPRYGVFSSTKSNGWLALRAADYFRATKDLARAIARDSTLTDERWGLAIAYYYRSRYDSAAMVLPPLIRLIHERSDKQIVIAYNALDQIEYMAAVAWKQAGQLDSARAAASRALTENLSRYRAHALLADIALQSGDSATAEQEWMLAGELAPNDVSFRRDFARYLLASGRYDRAEQELRRIVALNPDYVNAHYDLAIAIDRQGRKADALAQYQVFLGIAPTAMKTEIGHARARVEELK